MSNTKHTPGPWYLDIDKTGGNWDYNIRQKTNLGKGRQIAELNPHVNPFKNGESVESNAALIAAAPDLLEALKLAESALEGRDSEGQEYAAKQARAAIAKAEGR